MLGQPSSDLSPEMRALIEIAKLASESVGQTVSLPMTSQAPDCGSPGKLTVCPTHSSDLFWLNLSKCAARHGMTPFFNRFLLSAHIESAPSEIAEAARESASFIIRHNLLATADLAAILSEFAKAGIFVIPIKGPALAWMLYRDLSLREFSDLDLLIDIKDVGESSGILNAMGYEPELKLTTSQEKIFVKTENVLLFTHAKTGRLVELHWELSPRYLAPPIDMEVFRKRLTTVEPGAKTMKTMSEEDTLIYLCAHGAKHHWERLNWVTDIAALVNRSRGMDWDYVFEHAERRRSGRMLLLGLIIACDLLGARLPDRALDLIRESSVIFKLAEDVRGWLFREPEDHPGFLRRWIFYSRLQKGLSDKLRFAFLSVAAPNMVDWQSVDLPDSLSALYFLARPLRLLSKLTRRRRDGETER